MTTPSPHLQPAWHACTHWQTPLALTLGAALCLTQTACSLVSPYPTIELIKASGAATSQAIMSRPGVATNTVTHQHAQIKELCIEFNPQAQVADVVPALQNALHQLNVDSRVYDNVSAADKCPIWLRYNAFIDWDTPPFSDRYTPYVSTAALTLQNASGQVLASSNYVLTHGFERSKWASTQNKLGPVVAALINGNVQ